VSVPVVCGIVDHLLSIAADSEFSGFWVSVLVYALELNVRFLRYGKGPDA